MEYVQKAFVLAFTVFAVYLFYYYVVPVLHFRLLLIKGYKKHQCTDIQLVGRTLTVKYTVNGEEKTVERTLKTDIAARFMATAVCVELKGILAEIG